MTQVADIHGDVFSTHSELVGQRLCVELTGCLDMETAPALERFLGALTRSLSSEHVREIEFATGGLYLMSSSAISHLAAWVKRLKQVSPGSCIRFRTNPNLAWQRRTFDSIRRVAESIVVVD
jgi:anti-anti-sigma regulatory factor